MYFTSAQTPSLCNDCNRDSIVPLKFTSFLSKMLNGWRLLRHIHNPLQCTKQQVKWYWGVLAAVFLSHFDRNSHLDWPSASSISSIFLGHLPLSECLFLSSILSCYSPLIIFLCVLWDHSFLPALLCLEHFGRGPASANSSLMVTPPQRFPCMHGTANLEHRFYNVHSLSIMISSVIAFCAALSFLQ